MIPKFNINQICYHQDLCYGHRIEQDLFREILSTSMTQAVFSSSDSTPSSQEQFKAQDRFYQIEFYCVIEVPDSDEDDAELTEYIQNFESNMLGADYIKRLLVGSDPSRSVIEDMFFQSIPYYPTHPVSEGQLLWRLERIGSLDDDRTDCSLLLRFDLVLNVVSPLHAEDLLSGFGWADDHQERININGLFYDIEFSLFDVQSIPEWTHDGSYL